MNIYLALIIFLLAFEWLLSLIVESLNLKSFSPNIPQEFAGYYDSEKYAKSQCYQRERTIFGEIKSAIMFIATLLFILLGGFAWINSIAQSLSEYMILQGLVFIGILILISYLAGLPFSLYSTFVIEERYGFNKTTAKTFIKDQIKAVLLLVIIGTPIISLLLFFFGNVQLAWLWSWAALTLISLFIALIAPVVILPLFNKFVPLEDGELRQKLEDYAKQQNYRLSGIFKVDASKRSTKLNAYFTGFGKTKRIALFDTLLEKLNADEILSVLAHEVGHCKLKHVIKGMVFGIATNLLMFFLLSFFLGQEGLYRAFQVDGTPIYAGLIFFFFIYTPLSMLLGLVSKASSRKREYEADDFSVKTTGNREGMITSLKKLTVDNLGNLTPHPLKVFLEYSHPPVMQRIKAIRKGDK